MARRISGEEFEAEVLKSERLVIVDFYSDTCIPCKQLSPILAEVEEEYADKINVYKINVAYDLETAGKYDVLSAPTLLFFKDAKEIARLTGVVPKEKIKEIIEGEKI